MKNNCYILLLLICTQTRAMQVDKIVREKGLNQHLYELLKEEKVAISEVRQLLLSGANIDCRDSDGSTFLMQAAEHDHLEVCAFLLVDGKVPIDAEDKWGNTALKLASHNGHLAIVKMLIRLGADAKAPYKYNDSPLLRAAMQGHTDIVRFLVKCGAPINNALSKGSFMGFMPLHFAVQEDYAEMCSLLLKKGAEVNVKAQGETPLFHAVRLGHYNVCLVLLVNDADLHIESERAPQVPLLWYPLASNDLELCGLLVHYGAPLSAAVKAKWGCATIGDMTLRLAASEGCLELCEMLFDQGVQVNFKINVYDITPLGFAAKEGHVSIVNYLLSRGAQVDAQNTNSDKGLTPLMLSSARGHREVGQVLLSHGAQVNYCAWIVERGTPPSEYAYYTPLTCAIKSGDIDTCKLLLENGALVNDLDLTKTFYLDIVLNESPNSGYSFEGGLLDKFNFNVTNAMPKRKKGLVKLNFSCNSPLIVAADVGYDNMVGLLVENGADSSYKNRQGETALVRAAKEGHAETCEALLSENHVIPYEEVSWAQFNYLFTLLCCMQNAGLPRDVRDLILYHLQKEDLTLHTTLRNLVAKSVFRGKAVPVKFIDLVLLTIHNASKERILSLVKKVSCFSANDDTKEVLSSAYIESDKFSRKLESTIMRRLRTAPRCQLKEGSQPLVKLGRFLKDWLALSQFEIEYVESAI